MIMGGGDQHMIGGDAQFARDARAYSVRIAHFDQIDGNQGDAAAAVIEQQRAQEQRIVHRRERSPHGIERCQILRRDVDAHGARTQWRRVRQACRQYQRQQACKLLSHATPSFPACLGDKVFASQKAANRSAHNAIARWDRHISCSSLPMAEA